MAPAELPIADPGPVVVVLAPASGREATARSLTAILATTAPEVPILVAAGPAERALLQEIDAAGGFGASRVFLLDSTATGAALALAATQSGRADVAVVHPDVVVGPGWLEGLRAALGHDHTLASASALSNHGAFASVPARNLPWTLPPHDLDAGAAAEALRERSPRVHPRIPVALAHTTLLRRSTLDLLADPFAGHAAPQAALDAFSTAATAVGLRHVLADDVFVDHRGGAAEGEAERSPALTEVINEAALDRWSALSRAVGSAAAILAPLSITVDARCLGGGVTGSTVTVLELLAALHRAGARPRVLLPEHPGEEAERVLATLHGIERLPISAAVEGAGRTAIVHRPWQVDSAEDLQLLDLLGERLVITHHDFIAYRNPEVFGTPQDWLDHRRITREGLALAAVAIFLCEHARGDALADDLLDPARARVVGNGVDHHAARPAPAQRPSGLPAGVDRAPFLVCLGSRFRHKNHVFALALLDALRERGWEGGLVIAGREVPNGSSAGAEAAFLATHPGTAGQVHHLPSVDEAGKAWLLEHAAAVLVPSTIEGFGLVPFEAAAAGTPALVAPVASFAELLDAQDTLLVPWDAAASAERVLPVLRDPAAAEALVERIRHAGARHTWDRHAELVLEAYAEAQRLPAPRTAPLARSIAEVEHAYWSQRGAVGAGGWSLVDPQDPLLTERDRATLVAAATGDRTRPALVRFARALTKLRR